MCGSMLNVSRTSKLSLPSCSAGPVRVAVSGVPGIVADAGRASGRPPTLTAAVSLHARGGSVSVMA